MFIELKERKIGKGENTVLCIPDNFFGYFSEYGYLDLIRMKLSNEHSITKYNNGFANDKYSNKLSSIKSNMEKDENIICKICNIIYKKNNLDFDRNNLFFNNWISRIKEYDKLKFLENLGDLYYNNHNFYIIKDEYLIILSVSKNKKLLNEQKNHSKNFVSMKVKIDEIKDSEMISLIKLDYSPALIYLYEVYKKEKESGNKLYRRFPIKEPDKIRIINAPNDNIKKGCKVLLRPLNAAFNKRLLRNGNEANQFAYIKNKSIKDNANFHKNNKHEIRFDLKHFFDSCKYAYWKKYIDFLFGRKYDNYDLFKKVEDCIKEVLINPESEGLYMGNPVSGVLSNMIMNPVMVYINRSLNSKMLEYDPTGKKTISCSIYADDITFSTNMEDYSDCYYFSIKYLSSLILGCLEYYELNDFKLKFEKTLKNNIQTRKVTGLRINHKNEITIERYKYDHMKVMCDYIRKDKKISIPITTFAGQLSFYISNDESGKFLKLAKKYKDDFIKIGINKKLPRIIFEGE